MTNMLLITCLGQNVHCRDSFLKGHPRLLPDLVDKAVSQNDVHSKYMLATVALLWHPLPPAYALPASVQNLFLRLVDKAAEDGAVESLKPVYSLLEGTSTLLVGILSDASLGRLESQLDSILRGNHSRASHAVEDHLRTLYCLSIMHIVSSVPEDARATNDSFCDTQDLLASTRTDDDAWSPDGMRAYFSDSAKAAKTVQLVVLQAMWACQAREAFVEDRALTLTLARSLIEAVSEEARDVWCSTNGAIAHRLQQKALACNADKALQIQAFAFLCQLCRPVALQTAVVEGIRFALTSVDIVLLDCLARSENIWTNCFRAVSDAGTVERVLQKAIGELRPEVSSALVNSADHWVLILRQLRSLIAEQADLTDSVFTILSQGRQLQHLAHACESLTQTAQATPNVGAGPHNVCPWVSREAYQRVVHALCELLLSCGLQTQFRREPMARDTVDVLLQLHALTGSESRSCLHRTTAQRPAPGPKLLHSEEAACHASREDWRQLLSAHMTSEMQQKGIALRHLFAKACQQLEERCENVEEPLRLERAAHSALRHEYDEVVHAYDEIEAQLVDSKVRADTLEEKQVRREAELEDAREQADTLTQHLEKLEEQMERVRKDASDGLAALRQQRDAAELEHLTRHAKDREELEDLRERLDRTEALCRKYDSSTEVLRSQLHDTQLAKDEVISRNAFLERELKGIAGAMTSLQVEHREAMDLQIRLEGQLRDAKNQLDQVKHDHERNICHIREQARQNAEAANASHNEAMDRLAAIHGEEVASMERRTEDCEQQIRRLQRLCKQKDAQIAEANRMRTNLLTALGGDQQMLGTLPHRTRSSARSHPECSQVEATPGTPSFCLGVNTQDFNGSASLASNASSAHSVSGPTPKRSKPRKSIKIASPAKSKATIGVRAARTSMAAKSTVKRRALHTLSTNASPRKEAPITRSKVGGQQNQRDDDFDDSTFDESEFGMDAPDVQIRGVETLPDDETRA